MADFGKQLEIYIYLLDGSRHDFFIDDQEEIARVLGIIKPNSVFGQKQIMLAGTYFMGGFRTDQVTRVDLVCDNPPFWPQIGGVTEILEIEEEMLRRKAKPRYSDTRRSEVEIEPGEILETYAEFGLADGRNVCVRMSLEVHGAIDQRARAYNMFTGAGFHINRRGGGIILINPRHVMRWSMYPGPAESSNTAWKAHRLDSSEWGGAPSQIFEKMDLSLPEGEEAKEIPPSEKVERAKSAEKKKQ